MKKMILAAALFLAGGLSAFAGGAVPPPAKYVRPYKGKLTIVRLDIWDIRKVCGGLAQGCAVVGKGRCTIYISKYNNWIVDRVKRHEIAHCNGWRHG